MTSRRATRPAWKQSPRSGARSRGTSWRSRSRTGSSIGSVTCCKSSPAVELRPPRAQGFRSNLSSNRGISSSAWVETPRSKTAVAIIEASTTPKNDGDSDVALAASGDRQAFERLYRQHVNRVFSLCARMVADRLRAEELTQDVFVRAWEKLHLFRGESSFGTWLHRMTVNVVLNARKSDGRRQSRFEDSEDDNGGVDSVASSSTSGTVGMPLPPGDLLDLEEAIGKLPPGARRVFVLHDVEGYKHEEIAEMLGVTTGATKAQLHRARLLLREALNR